MRQDRKRPVAFCDVWGCAEREDFIVNYVTILTAFSLRVGFASRFAARPPKVFRILGWLSELAPSLLAPGLEYPRRPEIASPHGFGLGIPENPKAALAKTDIRSKAVSIVTTTELY